MSVKRPLKLNETYVIKDVTPGLSRTECVGQRVKVLLQQADDGLPAHFLSVEGLMLSGPRSGQRVLLQGVRLRQHVDERPTCRCKGYPFPHHRGKGRCNAATPGPYCGDCGKTAEYTTRRKEPEERTPGRLTGDWMYASKCCSAPLFHDPELQVPFSED